LGKDINPIYASERAGDIKHSNADIDKAKIHFEYSPSWSFKSGIEKYILRVQE
jgi:UDP-N-acetylglucosamine 4-epimerase